MTPQKDNVRTLDETRKIVTEALREIKASAASVADTLQSDVLHNAKVLRTVATMLEDGLVLLDKDSRITIFNPAASSIFGVNPAEAVGKSFDQLFPGLARRLQEGTNAIADLHTLDETGRQGVVNLSFTRLVNPDEGTPFTVLLAAKESEEQIERRQPEIEGLYQAIVWSLPVPALFTDAEGQVVTGSHEFYETMGRTPQQLTGRAIEEILPADAIAWYYGDKERSSMRMTLATPSGVQEFVAHKTPVMSHDKSKLHGFITVLIKQVPTIGQENELVSTFIRTIDALPSPIMLVSFSEGRILLVNKAFGATYHYDRKDILNKKINELSVDGTVTAAKRAAVLQMMKGEDSMQRVRIKDSLGNRVWVTVKAIPVQTDGGKKNIPKYVLLTGV